MGQVHYSPGVERFEYRNLDYINTSLVQNTWYTALATTRNVRAWYLVVEQTNNGAAAENIEVELTIDGTSITDSQNMNSGDVHYLLLSDEGAIQWSVGSVRQILSLDADQSAPLQTRSLGIRVRQTSAVDVTSAIIEVNLVYTTKGGGT